MPDVPQILFLPGAGGNPSFWRPLGDALPAGWRKMYVGWPGLGDQPHDPAVRGIDDLVVLAERRIDGPVIVAAQSMGGIVAIRLALRRPQDVRGLILTVTSGGVDLAPHRPTDWRNEYRRNFPKAAAWIYAARADHAPDLARIQAPTLLIWGDADPISPVSIGEELQRGLPEALLHVVTGGTHDLVRERASEIASLAEAHIRLCWAKEVPGCAG